MIFAIKSYWVYLLLTVVVLVFVFLFIGGNSTQKIARNKALSEVDLFKKLVEEKSSYLWLSKYNLDSAIQQVKRKIDDNEYISAIRLSRELGLLLSEIRDRHSYVRTSGYKKRVEKFLPFAVAPWRGKKVIALREQDKYRYLPFLTDYPILCSIENIGTEEWLNLINYQNKHAPKYARHTKGVTLLTNFGEAATEQHINIDKKLAFTFSDLSRQNDTTLYLQLSDERYLWRDCNARAEYDEEALERKDYHLLFKYYSDSVAYLSLPRMLSKQEDSSYFAWLTQKMGAVKNSKALILDIRNNNGGTRDILRLLAPYFIPSHINSWVGNVAKVRVDTTLNQDIPQMSSRGLYTYNSPYFNTLDQEAITKFINHFEPSHKYDSSKFSNYYYMVINHKNDSSYHYSKPVYILMNELSFSASSVFAGVLKGLGKVTLVGANTDGSSGLSREYRFSTSGIKVRISKMLSFQRNGNPFDGYGTAPDIFIDRSLKQILGLEDHQLHQLLNMIQSQS